MQRYGTVAAIGSTASVSIGRGVRAGGIGYTVNPDVAFTCHLLVNACCRLVDGQMQRYGAVATISSATFDSEGRGCSTGSIGHTINPNVAFASFLKINTSSGVINSQVQGHDRVTTSGVR